MSGDAPLPADAARMGAARAVIRSGLDARAYPAAVIEVGRAHGPIWREAFGRLSYDAGARPTKLGTIFDLASLTKVIATTTLAMRAVREGRLLTRDAGRRSTALLARRGSRRRHHSPTARSFLRTAGARAPLGARTRRARSSSRPSLDSPLERAPGTAAVYSDVGFMLLGFLLEDAGRAPLDQQFATIASTMNGEIRYLPPPEWREWTAPTEADAWRGRVLQGEVHDENAAALGGVAGHAGLFGTAGAVGTFARLVLAHAHAHDRARRAG